MKLSIIVPCFNEEAGLRDFYQAVTYILPQIGLKTELIFVDDGSTDATLSIIKNDLPLIENVIIRYISFSRNFGKEAAILAGLQASTGNYIVLIDADLQDDPTLLIEMYKGITQGGYDCVAVRRLSRKHEPIIRSFFSKLFYRLMGKLSHINVVSGERDFRMMSRQVVDSVLLMNEKTRYSKGLFAWVGFNTLWLEEKYQKRKKGCSKWSFSCLCGYAIDAIICFSDVPLALVFVFAMLLCIISAVGIIFIVVRQLLWGGSAYGWSSLVCIILFIAGIQLFCIGFIGQYLAKIYTETKNRPVYIVRENGDVKE